MSFLLTDIAPIHSQTSPQLTFTQSGGQILSQSPSCPTDKQIYRPPFKPGYIYVVIKPKLKNKITVRVEWGTYQEEQTIDLAGYDGVVVRLDHLKSDSVPLTVTVKCGDIIGLVKQYEEGNTPKEWTDPKYEQRPW